MIVLPSFGILPGGAIAYNDGWTFDYQSEKRAMGHDDHGSEPADIQVFYPDSIELIGSLHDALKHRSPPPPPQIRSRKRVVMLLFVATCLSTFLVGMNTGSGLLGPIPGTNVSLLDIVLSGRVFSVPFAQLQVFLTNGLTSPREIVGNSNGNPPAHSTPRLTASATSRRFMLQLLSSL